MTERWSRMTGLSDSNPRHFDLDYHVEHETCQYYLSKLSHKVYLPEIVYCKKVDPDKYEIFIQWKSGGNFHSIEWIGSACCEHMAKAKCFNEWLENFN